MTTKLSVPRARPNLVSRPRLTERLNEGLAGKLTLVSAPAGFGKTTLLSEWARQNERAVAWLSLDEGDNDPARFWTYFLTALDTLQAGIGSSALARLHSPQPPPIESTLTALINEIASLEEGDYEGHPHVLVLDDYHVIQSQPVHQALAFLLDHLPPNMHLVIATRADPPLPLARLRGGAQLSELRSTDLRFRLDEAAAFLNEVMGLNLSPEDVDALEARTEGWIVGLQLAALSMRGRDDVQRFVRAFAGSSRYVMDYLVEEVIRRQPADARDFLLKTSVLERFTASLCDAVTGRDDSREVLLALEQANLFIVPLDESREWFRYHHLFADLLRHRLNVIFGEEQVACLHARACQWCEANELPADAVRHALAAADWERAATLIHNAAETMLKRGEVTTLLGWFKALPQEELRAWPQLCYDYSWPLILTGQIDAAESYLEQAEQGAQDDRTLLGNIAAAKAYAARVQGDDRRTIELSERALVLLPQDDPLVRSVVAMNLGIARWNRGHLTEAERALTEADQAAQRSGNTYTRLTALSYLGRIQAARGKLHRAEDLYRQALRVGKQSPATAHPHIGLSALFYEWNKLEAATDHVRQGIELSQRTGNVEVQISGYQTLARIRQAQGDGSGALAALEKASQLTRDKEVSPAVRAQTAACHAQIALAQGDLAAATRWADEVPAPTEATPFYTLPGLVQARLLLVRNQKAAAASQLEAWYARAVRAGWQFAAVETRVLQALAAPTLTKALTFLADALGLAQLEGYVRTFVDQGEPLAVLLREAASRGIAPDYLVELLAAFELEGSRLKVEDPRQRVTGSSKPPNLQSPDARAGDLRPATSQPSTVIESLSERELEVLRLLAEGRTYQEIARALFISVNTVKTHLQHIYHKLGAHNRREAAAKARELNLLP